MARYLPCIGSGTTRNHAQGGDGHETTFAAKGHGLAASPWLRKARRAGCSAIDPLEGRTRCRNLLLLTHQYRVVKNCSLSDKVATPRSAPCNRKNGMLYRHFRGHYAAVIQHDEIRL